MTTDTLHVYDQLVNAGFSDAQARAMIPMIVARRRADSEVLHGLEEILRKIDANHHLAEQLLRNAQRF